MATFSSGGLSIAYDDIRPGGPSAGTIVLAHGFATNRSEMWRRMGWYGALERKGYRTIALDLRGHGESDKPHDPSAYAGEALLGDVLGLMDHLGIERADLMGYSMGARLALQAALAHPERIANLIIGGVGGRMLAAEEGSQSALANMADAMEAQDSETIADPILKSFRLFAEEQGADLLALAAFTRGRGGSFDPAELGRLTTPTLVVAGVRDDLAGDPQALADAIPGARATTLPGCDHFSAIGHALYKGAVFDFLEGWLE
jgi:pimeloyl-ACP methyl ester carboxylesterase